MRAWRDPRIRWKLLLAAAFALGWLPVVLALTVHNRGSNADPDCIRHCYTLAHRTGPLVLAYVGAPLILTAPLAALLALKSSRNSTAADRAAWTVVVASCVICLLGLITIGIAVLPVAALSVAAAASAPLGPTPPFTRDPGTRRASAR